MTANGDAPLLVLDGVVAGYGGILALRGVSVEVRPGEIVTLIGSNGAGKSTTLRAISGLVKLRQGAISFDGHHRLDHIPPHKIVHLGVSHAPEGRGIFHRLSVRENLEMGAYVRGSANRDDLDRVLSIFPRLKERINQSGGTLSGGEQQMLAIGRALMANPRLLLLDEPSMGLSPILTEVIFETIRDINTRLGTTILLVEQNAYMALAVASRGYVLESGQIALHAPASELAENADVRRLYLGET